MPQADDPPEGGRQDIDIRSLPASQRLVVHAGPYAIFAAGAGLLAYALAALAGSMGSTAVVLGALLMVAGAVLPRARSLKISATGLTTELDGLYTAPSVAPRSGGALSPAALEHLTGLASLRSDQGGGGGARQRLASPAAPAATSPTIGQVASAAGRQGWSTDRADGLVALTSPDGHAFRYSQRDEGEAISGGFLTALVAFGLRWPEP